MGTSVSLNATSYTIPAIGEDNWGTDVSNYLIALATGVLSKAGGTFTLTADVDFGGSYGLKSTYYKSRGTVSSAGIVRLANNESLGWRNAANGADKLLKVNASDILEFDGNPIPTIALGAADTVLQMNGAGTAYEFATINNANVNASAAIAVSKLAALTASRAVVSDGSGFLTQATTTATEIGYVNGVTSAIQTQLDAKFLSSNVIDEDNMASNLDTKVPTQQSVKAYVDSVAAAQNQASEISYSNATSGLTATDVQAAIDEVEARLQTAEGDISTDETNLSNHISDTSTHGTTGAIVGTTDAQVLTAKDYDGGTASNTNRTTLAKNTSANLSALNRKQGNLFYDTDLGAPVFDTGSALVQVASASSLQDSSLDYKNGTLAASVGSSALTIALKDKAGSDPSAGSPVSISFRSATAATGTYVARTVTGALSVVVSSGSTLGHADGHTDLIYVYAIDNAGTVELAVSSTLFDDGTIKSTTAEGGAGAADSQTVLYSTTARTDVAIRLIGRIKSSQTTAGTWATSPSEISNIPFSSNLTYPVNMDDVTATRLGLKDYRHGTSYRASIAPTITFTSGTGSLSAITYSRFVPRQLQSGEWVLSGRFTAQLTSVTRTSASFSVNGITLLSGTSAQNFSGTTGLSLLYSYTGDGGSSFIIGHASGTTTEYYCSFTDLVLASKPTWAY